jgi:hypothetical protein
MPSADKINFVKMIGCLLRSALPPPMPARGMSGTSACLPVGTILNAMIVRL